MHELHTYRIQLGGQVTADDINGMSPLTLTVEKTDRAATWLSVHTDQSGLIGLMRHLHGLGCVFLSVNKESEHD